MLDLDAQETALPGTSPAPATPTSPAPALPPGATLLDVVDASQRQAIQQALAQHQDNWAAAARQLGLDASNLHKLARRLGVKR